MRRIATYLALALLMTVAAALAVAAGERPTVASQQLSGRTT